MREECKIIGIEEAAEGSLKALFIRKGGQERLSPEVSVFFDGSYGKTATFPVGGQMALLVGLGEKRLTRLQVKEVCAKAVSFAKEQGIERLFLDVSPLMKEQGIEAVRDITEGALLGNYCPPCFGQEKQKPDSEVRLCGIPEECRGMAQDLLEEACALTEGVKFARDMVNLPGNHLRPQDLADQIQNQMKGLPVETVCYDAGQLKEMKMDALLAVGESSAFSPCLLVLRYRGDQDNPRITGLVGKGVTCDTGGYCLKGAGSMKGIKGDMAGGAAVAGAIYALAKRKVKTNATAVIPLCENRISPGSLLPGDVISSYSGKTIEVGNTDAEGRLILADAVSYAIRKEHVTEILDIATLTGAVVGMLGFTVGGVLCDHEEWYREFERAFGISGERYLRIPFYEEHEKMIKSQLADVRNTGEDVCGTITAGLFIREFAEGKPWLHLDIAGTAWVNKPVFAFQKIGATGAGVTTIYQLCCREG